MSPRHPRRQTTTGVAENEDDQKLRTSLLDNEVSAELHLALNEYSVCVNCDLLYPGC